MYLESVILFIFTVPIWVIIRFVLYIKNRKYNSFSLKREMLLNIFFLYILCLFSVTFFPMYIHFDEYDNWISVNFIPIVNTVKEIIAVGDSGMADFMIQFWIKNIVGNFILLLPLGFFMPILWNKFQDGRKTVLFAFCFSLSIELLQLLLMYIGVYGRAFDIDDIILNTLGACIGYLIYKKFIGKRVFVR